jgi:hypothetical protein
MRVWILLWMVLRTLAYRSGNPRLPMAAVQRDASPALIWRVLFPTAQIARAVLQAHGIDQKNSLIDAVKYLEVRRAKTAVMSMTPRLPASKSFLMCPASCNFCPDAMMAWDASLPDEARGSSQ